MTIQGYGTTSLAAALSKDPSQVSLWINRKRKISTENAYEFTQILKCTIRQLKGEEPFTKFDLTNGLPPIGTARRYIQAIHGKWHAISVMHIARELSTRESIPNIFQWTVDLVSKDIILSGKAICITPDHQKAQYTVHLEPSALGLVLVDGIRDVPDGATDVFRGILQFHSDIRTTTMKGMVVTHWPVLQRICTGELTMTKNTEGE